MFGDFNIFSFLLFVNSSTKMLTSDCGCVCRRVADVGKIDRMFRNRFSRVRAVRRRARAQRFGAAGRAAGQDERVVDGRLGVAPFDLVLPFLQHCRLKNKETFLSVSGIQFDWETSTFWQLWFGENVEGVTGVRF